MDPNTQGTVTCMFLGKHILLAIYTRVLAQWLSRPSAVIIWPFSIVICKNELDTEASKGLNEGSSLQTSNHTYFAPVKCI